MAKRKTCSHCRAKVAKFHDWTVEPCAMDPKVLKAKLCTKCDIEVNEFILTYFRVRNRKKLIDDYRKGLTAEKP